MKTQSFAVVSVQTGKVIAEYIHLGFSGLKYEGLSFALVQQDDDYEMDMCELPVIETHEVTLSSSKGFIDQLEKMKSEKPYRTFTVCKDVGGFDLMLCLEPKAFLDDVEK